MFSIKETNGEGIKMFTLKQMLQILRIAISQVKVDALNETSIIYSLYRAKTLPKK